MTTRDSRAREENHQKIRKKNPERGWDDNQDSSLLFWWFLTTGDFLSNSFSPVVRSLLFYSRCSRSSLEHSFAEAYLFVLSFLLFLSLSKGIPGMIYRWVLNFDITFPGILLLVFLISRSVFSFHYMWTWGSRVRPKRRRKWHHPWFRLFIVWFHYLRRRCEEPNVEA